MCLVSLAWLNDLDQYTLTRLRVDEVDLRTARADTRLLVNKTHPALTQHLRDCLNVIATPRHVV